MGSRVKLGYVRKKDGVDMVWDNRSLDTRVPRLGGFPSWSNESPFPSKSHFPLCTKCSVPMPLLIQISIPKDAHRDRTLYLFGCNNKECCLDPQRGWIALRSLAQPETSDDTTTVDRKLESVAIEDAWNSGSESESDQLEILLHQRESNNAAKESQKHQEVHSSIVVHRNNAKSSKQEKDAHNELRHSDTRNRTGFNQFPCFLVDFRDEVSSKRCASSVSSGNRLDDSHIAELLSKYKQEESSFDQQDNSLSFGEEVYEQSTKAQDKPFRKFMKRIDQFPSQIVRIYSSVESSSTEMIWPVNDSVMSQVSNQTSIPKCEFCGASRFFELQLLSTSLYYLHSDQDAHFDHAMDWTTVAVAVCSLDCTVKSDTSDETNSTDFPGYVREFVQVSRVE
mmetsp:Transcript_1521/g.2737  ORF Transcript_1521/g.2737 Transcript_1521/m.2737 type:complete len:394 (+) Transcript_1521:51-1232(+)